jgi:adenosylcobinamide amidohydrolase
MLDASPVLCSYAADDGRSSPVLVWRFARTRLTISSAPLGGGIAPCDWIVNAHVPLSYARTDPDAHLAAIAVANDCRGRGVGMMTAAAVERFAVAAGGDVAVCATVGISLPTWAAAPEDAVVGAGRPGTINIVAFVPARLSEAALVNAVMTVTEAKTQALFDAGVPGTGTASDAVCIACEPEGVAEKFGGPRSRVGAPLARAVHDAVSTGITRRAAGATP